MYRAQRWSNASGTWQYIASFGDIESARSYKDRASRLVGDIKIRIVDDMTREVY
jgi:hypothetical protein